MHSDEYVIFFFFVRQISFVFCICYIYELNSLNLSETCEAVTGVSYCLAWFGFFYSGILFNLDTLRLHPMNENAASANEFTSKYWQTERNVLVVLWISMFLHFLPFPNRGEPFCEASSLLREHLRWDPCGASAQLALTWPV